MRAGHAIKKTNKIVILPPKICILPFCVLSLQRELRHTSCINLNLNNITHHEQNTTFKKPPVTQFALVKKPQITQISIGKKTTNLHELTLIQLDKMLTLARL